MTDTALQRKNMVESQVRPSDVTDRRITGAMQTVAREAFLPPQVAALAYMDEAVPVAPGRSQMAPRTFARLAQAAEIQPSDKVLIVGALYGYSAAILATIARDVVALDRDASLTAAAKNALAAAGVANVKVETGPLEAGVTAGAPYDVIFVEGALVSPPHALLDQLATSGRLVAIEAQGAVGRAVVWTKSGKADAVTASRRVVFDAAAAVLPGFEPAKAFAF